MVQIDSLVYHNNTGTVEYRQRKMNMLSTKTNHNHSHTMAKYVLSVLFEIYNMG